MKTILVRYGAIPEVGRFRVNSAEVFFRGERVVVRTHRGMEIGEVLEEIRTDNGTQRADEDSDFVVLRSAKADDTVRAAESRSECEAQFSEWCRRIAEWNLSLELLDLEWTLDKEKLILYVLNDRGPECTKLALQAAAAGLGTVEVQPVNAEGLLPVAPSGGGCGCGSGGGGCHS